MTPPADSHEEGLSPELASAQSRARLVPAWIRVPLIVAAFAAAGYQLVAEVGVAGVLIDLQASMMKGKYYLVLTGALTLLATLLPVLALVHGLAFVFERRDAGNVPRQ